MTAAPPTGPLVTISTDVAVVGGSIAGLATALFAARRGLRVTMVDADEAAAPVAFDEAVGRRFRWTTPQAAHSHAFLARAFGILRDEAPELLADLAAAGVRMLPLTAPGAGAGIGTPPIEGMAPADDSLVVMLSRRTTFEAVLRASVTSAPAIDYHWGRSARGLLVEPGTVPHVAGVVLDDGTRVTADVVVDATGRRGDVHRWLAEAGVAVDEVDTDCGIAYHSRFYRLRLGQRWAGLNRGYTAGSSFDRYSCLVFPGDGDSFSVTFGVLPEDKALAGLRRDAAFQAAAEQIEVVADWVDPVRAEPISPVSSMTRMRNRLRRLRDDEGAPTATGIAVVADAAGISNPAHSRGCSLALWHAQRLADAIAATRGDAQAMARARDAALEEVLAPWVEDSRLQDAARLSRWRPDAGIPAPINPQGRVTNGEAYVAAQHDPVVWHAFTRLQQLLAMPDEVLADPAIVARVRAVQAAGLGLPVLAAPSHDELAAIVGGAAAREAGGAALSAGPAPRGAEVGAR